MSKQTKFSNFVKGRSPSNKKNEKLNVFVDHLQNTRDSKDKIRGQTGIVYDERMVEHQCLWDPNYPECPERFTRVLERCREYGLAQRCVEIQPRKATQDELLKLHTPDRIELLKGTDGSPDAEALEAISSGYDAIYIHPSTNELALLAAGSTVEMVDAILDGKIQNGMAVIRPPGHHAMKSEYCGYCFFNNVAVAAQHALDNKGVERILIVDWDVHHGQATQQMFYEDPRVLYFSVHRYEHGAFWPNLRESDFHYIGSGVGKGFNVNVPLNKTKMGNADYLAIWHQLLLPLAYEFQPELIIVSAGYDAALGCFEGEMEITPACYSHLTSSLMGLAQGKLAVVLEGGYCLKSLAEGAALTLRTLLGDPCPVIAKVEEPCQSIQESILSAIYVLRPMWKCLQFQGRFDASKVGSQKEGKHFVPSVTFEGSDVKQTLFATRNCYPVQSNETIDLLDQRLDKLIKETSLAVPKHRVCFIYDERMALHRNINEPGHPERPARITSIYQKLMEFGVLERCHRLDARDADREELLWLHQADYIDEIAATAGKKQSTLNQLERQYGSIFICPETYQAALLSAGSSLQIVESILSGESRSGIGVVRPPGHHAECDEAYGFCFFNNTALAAKYAIEIHHLERILIVDWDVHHGNGIQRMFEEDPRVLYISLHRFDIFPFKPEESDCNVVGSGSGAGYTVNIAWPKRGMGDTEYLAAFQQIIMPIAYQYNPQLVLVAAGFDAAQGDPLGGCKITPEGYGQMTNMLSSLAQGRVAILLEGGYNLDSISHSMTMCAKALLGDPLPSPRIEPLNPAAISTIKQVVSHLLPYWSSLCFHVDLPEGDVLPPCEVTKKPLSIEEQLEKLQLESSGATSQEPETIVEGTVLLLEACGVTEAAPPKTLQEFLLLPENVEAMKEGTLFSVVPLSWCPHIEGHVLPDDNVANPWGLQTPCSCCQDKSENWVCLSCYQVNCGRFVKGHMKEHHNESGHSLVLSFSDLSIWCYECDSYVDNRAFYSAKNRLHVEKFGEPLPPSFSG
ncbi:histone deacetylase 6-like isoform X3 [Daphnia pulex]|uniref:histone deacetylase 6-like isoform X3 n=1 Tax=Daphnia pulex TaxID=6669 RepID=UPI001EDDBCA7|nr:histone deacetylase 6-like isoform X3 [Daphnia pulex]